MIYPEYIERIDDGELFRHIGDGNYSLVKSGMANPHKYSYDFLINHPSSGFRVKQKESDKFRVSAYQIAMLIHRTTSYIPRMDGSVPALWSDLTQEQRDNAANAVKIIYSDPVERSAEQLHELWMEPMLANGWTVGPFNLEKKTHPSLVHFYDLPEAEVLKDLLWKNMIEAFRDFYTANDQEANELY